MTHPAERITIRVPVILARKDLGGTAFKEKTLATIIADNEATILSSHPLALGQELELQCIGTNRQALARVVEQLSGPPDGHLYGVEIESEDVNLWEIGFPSATEPEMAAGRLLLECKACHAQEVALLNASELEIFQVNQTILRPCQHCNEVSPWVKPSLEKLLALAKGGKLGVLAVPEPPARERVQNERTEPRLRLKVPGCVKTSEFGEEVVATENVSESGFCFRSRRTYGPGASLEIALPYVEGGANVFVKARIQWSQNLPQVGLTLHGARYVHARRRAKRVTPHQGIPAAFIGGGRHAKGSAVVISMVGVLVRCPEDVELFSHVRMAIETQQGTIRMGAVTKRQVSGVGMAFEFATMGPSDRMLLRRLILRVAKQVFQRSGQGLELAPATTVA